MTRISTLAQHQLTQAQIAQTQKRLQEFQIQLSSGHKAMRYSGIASDAGRLINLENAHMRMDQYVKSNGILSLRLETMELSVAKSFNIASELKTLLVNALNGQNAAELPLDLIAGNLMDELAGVLNVKLDGRYLFSGAATGTPPVNFSAAGFAAPPTVYPSSADTGYYQGNSAMLTARVADDHDVTWGATAEEEGFEKLIRALHLTTTATTSPQVDAQRLQEALDLVNQAIDRIPVTRARIAAAQNAIDRANESHADLKIYLAQTITDIKGVDVAEAVTRMTNDQILLEASFMTVSRLAQLSLANYLR